MNPIGTVSVVFPCFNDAATFGGLVETARSTLACLGLTGEVVVGNDGSSDGSADVLAELERRISELHVVTHACNQGYGGAIRAGFTRATGDWVHARFPEIGVHHYRRPYGRSHFFRPSATTGTVVDLVGLWRELRPTPVEAPDLVESP